MGQDAMNLVFWMLSFKLTFWLSSFTFIKRLFSSCSLSAIMKVKLLSRVQIFATPWIVAYLTPPSLGFSKQEYWSGFHFLLQKIFLTQGLNPGLLPCRQALYRLSHQGSLSSIRVVSSAYQRLLIFLLAILTTACASSSPTFLMMYSAYKLNKQGDNIQPWHTPFLFGTSLLFHVKF